jgi:hypothetical protein
MSGKIGKNGAGTAGQAKPKPATERRQIAGRILSEPKSSAPHMDPVGKYMHEHRGVLGKGYKLKY